MFHHPFLWLILSTVVYILCTYKGKKMEETLKKISFSKNEQIAGKVYSYAYFLCVVICFFSTLSQYHGTSKLIPFFKDFSLFYAKCSLLIELATFFSVKINKLNFRKIIYSAAKFLKIHPALVNLMRLFGLIVYAMCLLFEIVR